MRVAFADYVVRRYVVLGIENIEQGFLQLRSYDAYMGRRFDAQAHTVSRYPINRNGDLITNDEFFANSSA